MPHIVIGFRVECQFRESSLWYDSVRSVWVERLVGYYLVVLTRGLVVNESQAVLMGEEISARGLRSQRSVLPDWRQDRSVRRWRSSIAFAVALTAYR